MIKREIILEDVEFLLWLQLEGWNPSSINLTTLNSFYKQYQG